jgi:hypothetical protein
MSRNKKFNELFSGIHYGSGPGLSASVRKRLEAIAKPPNRENQLKLLNITIIIK